MSRRWSRALLALYLVVPAVLVLGPLPVEGLDALTRMAETVGSRAAGQTVALHDQDVEKAANLLLLLPLGALLVLAVPSGPRLAISFCAAAAVLGETAQAVVLVGRYPDVLDVVLNVAGGAAGALMASWWTTSRPGRPLRTSG